MENKKDFLQKLKNKIFTGTDVKQLQYEENAVNLCYNHINLNNILENKKKDNDNDKKDNDKNDKKDNDKKDNDKKDKNNCIVINIEKDVIRYESIVLELQKIGMSGFVHLKATYWKEKKNMINDLQFIIDFLQDYSDTDNKSTKSKLMMNDFSEINDPNIYIQDGPLACYCSHVRGMIYGHLNFQDYTIIIEDDAFISNTENIEKYIKEIPSNWDIILLNAYPLNIKYDTPWYKMKNTFHSTHFYIIKNSALPIIFKNIYPIYDQIDVLIAKLYNKLNIYNITDTVYQKNFSTNTQNNLNAIFNSPGYQGIRDYLDNIKESLFEYLEFKLTDNSKNNIKIVEQIFYDVIYNFIVNNFNYETSNYFTNDKSKNIIDVNLKSKENEDTYINDLANDNNNKSYLKIYHDLYIVINCCMKGKNVHLQTLSLMKDINYIIDCFKLHNTTTNTYITKTTNPTKSESSVLKAYSYGSTANTYLVDDLIIKVYNDNLRWKHENHNDLDKIFNVEIGILNKLKNINTDIPRTPILRNVDDESKTLTMNFLGTSLFEKFILPEDWKNQLNQIFDLLSENNIEYPEFNLKNIIVMNNNISFVDFGLAIINSDLEYVKKQNKSHLQNFIEILEKLNSKFSDNQSQINILYQTFITNMKIENKYQNNIF